MTSSLMPSVRCKLNVAAVAALGVFVAVMAIGSIASADLLGGNGRGGKPAPQPLPVSPNAPAPAAGVPLVALVYSEDATTTTSRLVIPKQYLQQAGWQKTAGGPALEGNVAESESPLRTVIAGVLLSAAAVSLLFMRKRRRGVEVAAVLLLVALGTFAATWFFGAHPAQANVGPPPSYPHAPPAGNKVVIEVVEQGDAVKFIRGTGH
jgi:hypothetical protein